MTKANVRVLGASKDMQTVVGAYDSIGHPRNDAHRAVSRVVRRMERKFRAQFDIEPMCLPGGECVLAVAVAEGQNGRAARRAAGALNEVRSRLQRASVASGYRRRIVVAGPSTTGPVWWSRELLGAS